jgi:hypothetical protein
MEKLVYLVKKGLLHCAEIPGAKERWAHTADWTCDRAIRRQRAAGLNSKRFRYAAMTSSRIFCKCCVPVALFACSARCFASSAVPGFYGSAYYRRRPKDQRTD